MCRERLQRASNEGERQEERQQGGLQKVVGVIVAAWLLHHPVSGIQALEQGFSFHCRVSGAFPRSHWPRWLSSCDGAWVWRWKTSRRCSTECIMLAVV